MIFRYKCATLCFKSEYFYFDLTNLKPREIFVGVLSSFYKWPYRKNFLSPSPAKPNYLEVNFNSLCAWCIDHTNVFLWFVLNLWFKILMKCCFYSEPLVRIVSVGQSHSMVLVWNMYDSSTMLSTGGSKIRIILLSSTHEKNFIRKSGIRMGLFLFQFCCRTFGSLASNNNTLDTLLNLYYFKIC